LSLKERLIDYHTGAKNFEMPDELKMYNLKLPPWICQPYVRPPPEQYLDKMKRLAEEQQRKEAEEENQGGKRHSGGAEEEPQLSRRKRKKLERKLKKLEQHPSRNLNAEGGYKFTPCATCGMPSGLKCESKLCKRCCKTKCYTQNLDCPGHKVMTKTNREAARIKYGDQFRGGKKGEAGENKPNYLGKHKPPQPSEENKLQASNENKPQPLGENTPQPSEEDNLQTSNENKPQPLEENKPQPSEEDNLQTSNENKPQPSDEYNLQTSNEIDIKPRPAELNKTFSLEENKPHEAQTVVENQFQPFDGDTDINENRDLNDIQTLETNLKSEDIVKTLTDSKL